MICKICNQNVKYEDFGNFYKHHLKLHNISLKSYYDKCLSKPNEGFCLDCGKPTFFKNCKLGYNIRCRSCNNKHLSKDEKRLKKIKKTKKEKYGDEYYNNRDKSKKTCLKLYGDENYCNTEKIKKTKKERYGDENYNNFNMISLTWKNKNDDDILNFVKHVKDTKLERYGDEYYNNREKSKKTCLKLYDDENFTNREKSCKTRLNNLKKYLNIFFKNNNLELIKYDNKHKCSLKCLDCGKIFDIQMQLVHKRSNKLEKVCIFCNPFNYTKEENDLKEFFISKCNFISNDRNVLNGKELDIYIPDLKLAFEFNGLYWHSELYKDKNYHLKKTEECEKQGIHLVHIYEDDWIYKKNIVKSRILNLLGKSKKIYARKTEIKEVSYKDSKDFLEQNHIQGDCMSKIRLGLYCDDELISLMTFGGLRKNLGSQNKEGLFELLRFCNKLNMTVVGGANKLFKYFINNYSLKEVISYADRSWTMNNGNTLYDKLGFKLDNISKPNYFYINNNIRENRFKYRKDVLVNEGFDKNKSEHQIMLERGIYRIYDSGNLKYILES
jgi:hypothetical protein